MQLIIEGLMKNFEKKEVLRGIDFTFESGKIYAAGLDALDNEPPTLDHPLLKARNCFITPHISWAALECRQRLVTYAIDNLKAFLAGTPTNIVNNL